MGGLVAAGFFTAAKHFPEFVYVESEVDAREQDDKECDQDGLAEFGSDSCRDHEDGETWYEAKAAKKNCENSG